MEPSRQDEIWNRAAMESGGSDPREGDIALAALLLAHGMVMNGGVQHALEVLTAEQYAAAVKGFRYFGLSEAASVLETARVGASDSNGLDMKYGHAVPTDSKLVHALHLKLLADPQAFAPTTGAEHA